MARPAGDGEPFSAVGDGELPPSAVTILGGEEGSRSGDRGAVRRSGLTAITVGNNMFRAPRRSPGEGRPSSPGKSCGCSKNIRVGLKVTAAGRRHVPVEVERLATLDGWCGPTVQYLTRTVTDGSPKREPDRARRG